jgi:hypothetical protein
LGWARENWSDVEGQLILAGVDPYDLDAAQLVNVCYSLLVTDISNLEVSRVEARETLDKRLAEAAMARNLKRGIKPQAEPFKLSPAMMAQMGIRIHKPPAGESK